MCVCVCVNTGHAHRPTRHRETSGSLSMERCCAWGFTIVTCICARVPRCYKQ